MKLWNKKTEKPGIELPIQVIELEYENYHILLESSFSDGTSSYWVIDTGASKTVLDKTLVNYYELIDSENTDDYQSAGINQGMTETAIGRLTFLRFGEIEIADHKVALIDLSHVNEIYAKYTSYPIAGLLGGDLLMRYQCKIDYAGKTIQFQELSGCPTAENQ